MNRFALIAASAIALPATVNAATLSFDTASAVISTPAATTTDIIVSGFTIEATAAGTFTEFTITDGASGGLGMLPDTNSVVPDGEISLSENQDITLNLVNHPGYVFTSVTFGSFGSVAQATLSSGTDAIATIGKFSGNSGTSTATYNFIDPVSVFNADATSGEWTIRSVTIEAVQAPPVVPTPAAFGAGLLGLAALLGRRA